MTKVRIDTPGVTVDIEADDPLDEVAAKALQVFTDAGGWPQDKPGPAVGFTAERRWSAQVLPTSPDRYGARPIEPVTAEA